MKKIVVLSDTHIPERAKDLPERIYGDLKSADIVLHAGDVTSLEFFKKLQKNSAFKVKAVQGNMDEPDLRKILPRKQLIKIDKFSIGLIHGWGSPFGLIEQVEGEFLEEKPDVIVFGHSHRPLNVHKEGILFFNPGSPTDKIFSSANSYGIITIDDEIHAKIIKV